MIAEGRPEAFAKPCAQPGQTRLGPGKSRGITDAQKRHVCGVIAVGDPVIEVRNASQKFIQQPVLPEGMAQPDPVTKTAEGDTKQRIGNHREFLMLAPRLFRRAGVVNVAAHHQPHAFGGNGGRRGRNGHRDAGQGGGSGVKHT